MSLKPTNSNPNPQIQVTGDKQQEIAKKLILEGDEQVASYKPQQIAKGADDAVTTDLEGSEKKNFDQKIYMFPEEYLALRRELSENHPELWQAVGYYMAFNGPMFVFTMNAILDMKLQFDTDKVAAICKEYLNRLRKHRGLSELS